MLAHAAEPTPENAQLVETRLADILLHQKPLCFENGPNDVLTQLEKSFYKLTHAMAECGCPNPSTLTVFEFYAWQESLEDKYKPLDNDARKRQ